MSGWTKPPSQEEIDEWARGKARQGYDNRKAREVANSFPMEASCDIVAPWLCSMIMKAEDPEFIIFAVLNHAASVVATTFETLSDTAPQVNQIDDIAENFRRHLLHKLDMDPETPRADSAGEA